MAGIRGKILKVPDVTPGLLFVDGHKKSYEMNGTWKSTTLEPAIEMAVDVELNAGGAVLAVHPISDADLAKEHARQAIHATAARCRRLAARGMDRVGKTSLLALTLLIIAWFSLDLYSIKISSPFFELTSHASMWHQIGFLNVLRMDMESLIMMLSDLNRYSGPNSETPPTGFMGVLGIVSLLAPLLPAFWKHKRALLGALCPLLFLLLLLGQNIYLARGIQRQVRDSITRSYSGLAALNFGNGAQTSKQLSAEAQDNINQQIAAFNQSIQFRFKLGFYVTLLSSLYLAGQGVIKYQAASDRANQPHPTSSPSPRSTS